MTRQPQSQSRPKKVLIVGGGPSGLVTLRNCLHRGTFSQVQLVERQDDIGGVWYKSDVAADDHCPRWSTPAYPGLIGNVAPEFLSFSEHPFPVPVPQGEPHQPFPTLAETNAYLKAFARPLIENGHVRLSQEVICVAEEVDSDIEDGGWTVRIKDWNAGGAVREETWDAVVITTGSSDNPHYPDVQGLAELQSSSHGTVQVQHAISWRGATRDVYEDKRVLVVGNANSANDMAAQLASVARAPVYRSMRRPSIFPCLPDARIQDVGPVTRYTTTTSGGNVKKITAHIKDGLPIEDIDAVLFGTGYYPHVPYVHVLRLRGETRALAPLTSPTTIAPARIPSLHRQILYAHKPTLAFIGALVSYTPFVLADLTSTWLALAWSGSGEIAVPATPEERLAYERERLDTLASQRAETEDPSDLVNFHFLGRHELAFAQAIRADVVRARPEMEDVLAKWDDAQEARRLAMYAAKLDSLYVAAGVEKPM